MSLDSPAAVVIDNPVIRMHPADNLVVARIDLPPGVPIDDSGLLLLHAVKAGNKIASRAIAKGEPILKYDTTIGFAITDIAPGEPIGADRIEYREFDRDYAFCKAYQPSALLPESERAAGHRLQDDSWFPPAANVTKNKGIGNIQRAGN